MDTAKIMIVEDDEVTALNLKMSLEKLNYTIVAMADNFIQARNKIKIYEPDVVLIDISLQESRDGIELANYIHTKSPRAFIFLTSHTEDAILDEAKKSEPYGYIVKPFDPNSLNATIQIALHRFQNEQEIHHNVDTLLKDKNRLEKLLYNKKVSDKPIVPFEKDYYLDISICETFYKGEKIKLTKKENAFIRLLVAQLGAVVSFEQAINYVWENEGATENSVRTLVWRLRNKLPTDIIKNSSGAGYYIEG